MEFHWMEGDPLRSSDTALSTLLERQMGELFVVPFNTPATKTQPNLTNKRLGEAKSQGFSLPGFDRGGTLPKT